MPSERLSLSANLANFMHALAMSKYVERWSLTTIREKLVKIGAKVVAHGRYATFLMAKFAVHAICSGATWN